MTRIPQLALLTPALLIPTAALAHPWGHDGFTVTTLLNHAATHPDHAALILAAAGFIAYRLWART